MTRNRIGAAVAVALVATTVPALAGSSGGTQSCQWARAGYDVGHSFSVPPRCTSVSPTTARTLAPRWFFHAQDSITASPVVVGTTLYVGSWDGTFYALDTETGGVRWTFRISQQTTSAFGRIVSTASVEPFRDPTAPGGKRLVVVFGGGSSLWALDAATGKELTHLDLDPRNAATVRKTGGARQTVEVESSPLVADVRVGEGTERRVYVGLDVHNDRDVGRTGVVAMRLLRRTTGWTLRPVWKFDPETTRVFRGSAGLTAQSGHGFGCAGVWSSPALEKRDNLVVFGTASCSYPEDAKKAGENWSEALWAVDADSGRLVWRFRPDRTAADAHLDDDFGAMPNVYTTRAGHLVVGAGRKDACYYARDGRTGRALWHTCVGTAGNLSNDFAIGGYLGTPSIETDVHRRAIRIIGASAIPIPHSARETVDATIVVRALDPATGKLLWTYRLAGPSYASTTVAGGVAFVPDTFNSALIELDASTGLPLDVIPLVGPPSSAPAVVGDSVYVTTGTRETDLEYKAFGLKVQQLESVGGASPLSPLSGIYRFSPAGG